MTKSDLKAVSTGVGIGLGAFFLVWLFRRTKEVRTINPALVKWEQV